MDLAPFSPMLRRDGCRGFTGPFPSTPLDAYGYVEGDRITTQPTDATAPGPRSEHDRAGPDGAANQGGKADRVRRRVDRRQPRPRRGARPAGVTVERASVRKQRQQRQPRAAQGGNEGPRQAQVQQGAAPAQEPAAEEERVTQLRHEGDQLGEVHAPAMLVDVVPASP